MIKHLSTLLLASLILLSCNKEDDQDLSQKPVSNSINKIMPLGASRVEGARPEFESYRFELWKDLKDGGHAFDFIGMQTDESSYPAHNGNNFDLDHEGYSGATSGDLLDGMTSILQFSTPDIVLFSSPGGNDALEGMSYSNAVSNINAIIDALQQANPNVTIIIEQMAPAKSPTMTPELSSFLTRIQAEVLQIASAQTTSNSKVIAVDMFTGFNDSHLADDVHYNQAGAAFIAQRYYAVLQNELQD